MATSGSFTFALTLDDLLSEGCERAGVDPASLAARQLISLTRSVNLALIEFENYGHSLYRLDEFDLTLLDDIRGYRMPEGTIDVLDVSIRNASNRDRQIRRIGRDEYRLYPTKETKAEPYSYFLSFDASDAAYLASIASDLTDPTELSAAHTPSGAAGEPIMVVYPCPDADSTYTLIGTRIRTHQTADNLDEDVDINRQWYEALCANVAKKAAEKYNRGEFDAKKALADESLYMARLSNGSKAPTTIVYSTRNDRRRRH